MIPRSKEYYGMTWAEAQEAKLKKRRGYWEHYHLEHHYHPPPRTKIRIEIQRRYRENHPEKVREIERKCYEAHKIERRKKASEAGFIKYWVGTSSPQAEIREAVLKYRELRNLVTQNGGKTNG